MPWIDRSVARRAWSIAWPLMLAESIDSILWIMDTFFVSFLGDLAVAAVGLGGYLSWLLFTGSTMMYMGALVLASQSIGAGDRGKAERVASEALVLNILLAVPISLAGIAFAGPMLEALNAGQALGLGEEYFRVRALGMPIVYAYMVYDALFRATGETKPVLKATAVGTLVNLLLDPVLILGIGPFPRLEIVGAALASVVAVIASLIILHRQLAGIGFRIRLARPSRLSILIARIGFPSMVERVVFVVGNVAYLGAVGGCGEKALAAHTIGVRVESLAFLPMFSLATAAGTMVGHEVGRGDVEEARRVGWEVAKASLVFGGIVGAVLVAASRLVPQAFTDDPEVARLAGYYLVIAGLTEPALGVEMTIAQIIRGGGNTIVPTVINLASLYILRVIPASILPGYMPAGLCAVGAWLAMAVDVGGRGVLLTLVYRRYFTRLARKLV